MSKISKSKQNKIIIAIVIIMLCNFTMPNFCFADGAANVIGGVFFTPIASFLQFVADKLLEAFQTEFMGCGVIYSDATENYLIRYSPGIIFSNMTPILDINFIHPAPSVKVKNTINDYGNEQFDIKIHVKNSETAQDINEYLFRALTGYIYSKEKLTAEEKEKFNTIFSNDKIWQKTDGDEFTVGGYKYKFDLIRITTVGRTNDG